MRTLRPSRRMVITKGIEGHTPADFVSICSTRNNCRLTVFRDGRLDALATIRNSRAYPGYERRLDVAAYTFARNFARRFLRKRDRRKSPYALYVKGSKKHAVLGLIDGGMRFSWVVYKFRGSFNGCHASKLRRTGRRRKKRLQRWSRPRDCARHNNSVAIA